jgi:hypothetical protein
MNSTLRDRKKRKSDIQRRLGIGGPLAVGRSSCRCRWWWWWWWLGFLLSASLLKLLSATHDEGANGDAFFVCWRLASVANRREICDGVSSAGRVEGN